MQDRKAYKDLPGFVDQLILKKPFKFLIILWIRNAHWTELTCLTYVLSEYIQLAISFNI